MLIKQKELYADSLISLWHNVFGDPIDYIRLFFKDAYYDSECFAKVIDGEAVSAFYLLRCAVKLGDKTYEGRYLYAAATLPEHRGKGHMSELIHEAIDYAETQKLDFIALVPASDSLYGYYGAFGFKEAMYKYRFLLKNEFVTLQIYREIRSNDEFYNIRSSVSGVLYYGKRASDYVFECLSFSDNIITAFGKNSYYIENEELFVGDGEETVRNYLNSLPGESVIYSNIPLSGAEKLRNGMLYCFNDELKNKEIYMNIALE